MTDIPIKLSATGRAMLTLATTREDWLVRPPQLPTAAARQVVRSLLNNGLVTEVTASKDEPAYLWRQAEDGTMLMLRATDQGFAAIGETAAAGTTDLATFTQAVIAFLEEDGCVPKLAAEDEPRTMIQDSHANGRSAALTAGDILAWLEEREGEEADAAEADDATLSAGPMGDTAADVAVAPAPAAMARAPDAPPVAPARATLRQVAQAVLDAWNNETHRQTDIVDALTGAMGGLQAALAGRPPRAVTGAPRKPRGGTKQEQVLALLHRPEGASGPQIAEATGWASHTVRGFLAGLKKKGVPVESLERVRQVGPNKQGAKGSYTIYRIAEAG